MAFRRGLDFSKPKSSTTVTDRYAVSFNSSSEEESESEGSGTEPENSAITSTKSNVDTAVREASRNTVSVTKGTENVASSSEDSEADSDEEAVGTEEPAKTSDVQQPRFEIHSKTSSNDLSTSVGKNDDEEEEETDETDHDIVIGARKGKQRLISDDDSEDSDDEYANEPNEPKPKVGTKPEPTWDDFRNRSYRSQRSSSREDKLETKQDSANITNVEFTIKLDTPPIGTASVRLDESPSRAKAEESSSASSSRISRTGSDEKFTADDRESRKTRLQELRKKRDYRCARLNRDDDGRDRPGVVPIHDPDELPEELSQELYQDIVRLNSQSELSNTESESICSKRSELGDSIDQSAIVAREESRSKDESADEADDDNEKSGTLKRQTEDSKQEKKKKKKKRSESVEGEDGSKSAKKKEKKKKSKNLDDESLATSDTESSSKKSKEPKKKKKKNKEKSKDDDEMSEVSTIASVTRRDSKRTEESEMSDTSMSSKRSDSRSPLPSRRMSDQRGRGDDSKGLKGITTEERSRSPRGTDDDKSSDISARLEALRHRREAKLAEKEQEIESQVGDNESVSARLAALRKRRESLEETTTPQIKITDHSQEDRADKESVTSRLEELRRRRSSREEEIKAHLEDDSVSTRLEALRKRRGSKEEDAKSPTEESTVSSRLEALRRRRISGEDVRSSESSREVSPSLKTTTDSTTAGPGSPEPKTDERRDSDLKNESSSAGLEELRKRSTDAKDVHDTPVSKAEHATELKTNDDCRASDVKNESSSARLEALRKRTTDTKDVQDTPVSRVQEKVTPRSDKRPTEGSSLEEQQSKSSNRYNVDKDEKDDDKAKSVETKLEVMRQKKASNAPRVGSVAKMLANIRQGKFIPVEEQHTIDAQEDLKRQGPSQGQRGVRVVVKATAESEADDKFNRCSRPQTHVEPTTKPATTKQEPSQVSQTRYSLRKVEQNITENAKGQSITKTKRRPIPENDDVNTNESEKEKQNDYETTPTEVVTRKTVIQQEYSTNKSASRTQESIAKAGIDNDKSEELEYSSSHIALGQEAEQKDADVSQNEQSDMDIPPKKSESFDLNKYMDKALDIEPVRVKDIYDTENIEEHMLYATKSRDKEDYANEAVGCESHEYSNEVSDNEGEEEDTAPVYVSKYATPVIDDYNMQNSCPEQDSAVIEARIVEDGIEDINRGLGKNVVKGEFSLLDGIYTKLEKELKYFASREVHYGYGEGTPDMFVNPDVPGYVGFANLPNQVHRKSVKKGFEFTLMVVGESGLGKSTLVNSLFLTDLYPERQIPNTAEKVTRTVKIEASTVEIEERGVKLRLTVVDTPGFADAIDSTECFKNIIKYIDDQYEKYLNDESGLNRRNIVDNRVHCCFYFINPAGHGLKPLDVAFMRAIDHKVNIIPVIAKADTLTQQEVVKLKQKILEQIRKLGIEIYMLPECDDDEDEDYKEQCRQLKAAVPFAVAGSSQVIEIKGRKVRGRMYPWGVVEVENPEHCDFIKLRTMLITHMQDLQEVTHEIHYESYRSDKLANGAVPASKRISKPRRDEEQLSQKEIELQQKDAELRRMQEMLAKMQAEMAKQSSSSLPGLNHSGQSLNGSVNGTPSPPR